MDTQKDTDNQLIERDVPAEIKQYKLVLEALFSDEQDTRLVRILVIVSAILGGINTIALLFLMFKK